MYGEGVGTAVGPGCHDVTPGKHLTSAKSCFLFSQDLGAWESVFLLVVLVSPCRPHLRCCCLFRGEMGFHSDYQVELVVVIWPCLV